MRWTPGGVSGDIEDRRGEGPASSGFSGFGIGGRGMGVGGTLILLVLSLIFGRNFFTDVGTSTDTTAPRTAPRGVNDPSEHREVQFVSFVLDDAQRTWDRLLPQAGQDYRHARLVLFRDVTSSACGTAESASGPFYCPADERVYLDLSFFDELARRFRAEGEFAQAYVIAHEIGHHVQKVIGVESQVRQLQRRNPGARNALSVKMELQADCFAGVWGNSTAQRDLIDKGDVEAGLRAAAAVGDDHIQKMTRGRVSPESFTHGSSAERVSWFRRGLESGRVASCDTFE